MKLIKKIIKNIFLKINGNFLTFWLRPVKTNKFSLCLSPSKINSSIAIIVQGPYIEKENFTYETLCLYKKNYPNCVLILSTWENLKEKEQNKICKLGVKIVVSKIPPKINGSNISRQMLSTSKGILLAKKEKCLYVCKTRTDQRMYEKDIFQYLIALLKKFPVETHSLAKDRIITISSNTYKNRLYDLNDMWNFGFIEDMEKYWFDSSCKNWLLTKEEILTAKTNESIIAANYLLKIGIDLSWTFENSLYCYSHFFIVINKEDIDLYWLKRRNEYFGKKYLDQSLIEYTFKDWIISQKE